MFSCSLYVPPASTLYCTCLVWAFTCAAALRHNKWRGPSSVAYTRLMTATSTLAHSKRELPLHCLQWIKRTHVHAHVHTRTQSQLFIVRPPASPSPWPQHAFCKRGVKKNKLLINCLSTQSSAFRLNKYGKSGSKPPPLPLPRCSPPTHPEIPAMCLSRNKPIAGSFSSPHAEEEK